HRALLSFPTRRSSDLRDAGSPSKRRRQETSGPSSGGFSFDLSASLSLPSFSWLSPSWALSLGISWLTSWLSYRPCSSARPSLRRSEEHTSELQSPYEL